MFVILTKFRIRRDNALRHGLGIPDYAGMTDCDLLDLYAKDLA